ncbi:MAG TPA: RNA-binding cell elongation regulator Jag/EloR [Acidimicrobiales bacterium]|nr:RNA-binding cell elongation regulator Jag/EloR [Acidimicrobiales bacterium]
MDWVETTGKSIEEATERALAHLGVHRDDAEVEVLEEPRAGLFGRVRGEARVRARVRPSGPRPKRSRRTGGPEERRSSSRGPKKPRATKSPEIESPQREKSQGTGTKRSKQGATGATPRSEKSPSKEDTMAEGISLAEQGSIAKEFLAGLLQSMNIQAEVSVKELDEETVEISVNATPPTELGLLVGPRGTTLQALQEVTRTVVQSKSPGRTDRILVDVAQYRERRVAALGRFAEKVAQEVVETGEERALEPMSAADRKAVHDALTDNSAVVTRSEGEEPRRFVVIAPA